MRALVVATAATIVACGGGGARRELMTGDPLPIRPARVPACEPAGGFRWIAAAPHVPLAISRPGAISGAGECCAAWARAGDRWTAVDARGAPLADVAITGGEAYDVSQCYELMFAPAPPDARLWVRGDRPWRGAPPPPWTPENAQRAALARLGGADPLFFVGAGGARRVAIGGPAAVIAELDDDGGWRVVYRDASWASERDDVYRVQAVLDLDGDGEPEVVFHRDEGASWDDVVVGRRDGAWQIVAESVGGATA